MKKEHTIKLSFTELAEVLAGKQTVFPKYTSFVINQVNRIAQATRPKIVGQMSQLIEKCPEKSFEGWRKWYLKTHPAAIGDATARISAKFADVKGAIDGIDDALIHKWVEDLVIVKTFLGLRMQEAILRNLAARDRVPCRLATPKEESKGIDGYLGTVPVSIKPSTYKQMKQLQEVLPKTTIFYEKTGSGVLIDVAALSRRTTSKAGS